MMTPLHMTGSRWPMFPRKRRPGESEQQKRPTPPLTEKEKKRLHDQHREWIRHIIFHAIGGFLLGALVVVGIIWLDINRIGTMIMHSDKAWLVVTLMVAGFGSTFGMVASGSAIYFKSLEDQDKND